MVFYFKSKIRFIFFFSLNYCITSKKFSSHSPQESSHLRINISVLEVYPQNVMLAIHMIQIRYKPPLITSFQSLYSTPQLPKTPFSQKNKKIYIYMLYRAHLTLLIPYFYFSFLYSKCTLYKWRYIYTFSTNHQRIHSQYWFYCV